MPPIGRRRNAWLRGLALVTVALLSVGCSSGHHLAGRTSASAAAPGSSGAMSPSSGSGSAPTVLPSASVRAMPTLQGSNVRLHKGQVLQVVLPASGPDAGEQTRYALEPAGTAVLDPVEGAPGFFTAAADGTAKVLVTQTPSCSPGAACAAHILNLGSVSVTVSG